MLRLKHILSILFLVMATSVLAQETYVIDSVCVGAERTYRRDGEAGYTYDWYIRDTLGTNVANPSGIDFSEVITPGDTTWGSEITYQWIDTGIFDIVVEVYTEHGCDTLEQGRVKVYPEPEVEVGEDQTVCALENIIVSGDAARNYSVMFWETSGDGSFSDDEQLHPTYYLGPNDSLAGSVTLTITAWGKADNITCEPAIDSIIYFFSNPEIELVVDDLLCFGDSTASVTATVTNGISPYNYSWTGPDGFTAGTPDISGLKTGEYILNVIDANGCEDTDTAWINEPTELLLSIDSIYDVSCYGYNNGFVNASATGGTPPYQFDLSGFSESGSNVNFNALPAGKYELILTDTNGCVVTDSVEVNEPDELIANIDTINSVQCYGSNDGSAHVSVVGGTGPFNYEWNTLPVQNTAWAVDLEPGTYSVIITDGNGCLAFDTVNITEPDPLVLAADSIDVRCGGKKPGSIDLHVSGGTPFTSEPYYRYEWQDTTGTVFATTEDVENLAGDQLYTVWVTDSLGCIEMHQVYINEIKNVELTAVVDSAKCYGDLWTIDVTATKGKQPYEFVWTDSTGVNVISNDEDMVDVPAGIYIVTVYDRDSCNETMNFVLEEPEELLAELYPDNDTICETEITRIQADPDGGTGAYTHLWTGSGAAFLDRTDTTDVYFGIAPPNNYQLIYTVTDQNSCMIADTIDMVVLPLIVDTLYQSLCANALPYIWNGVEYYSAGQYLDTLAGTIGCDTIRLLDLFIEPLERDTLYLSLCSNELPYNWNGTDLFTSGEYIDTIAGQIGVGCDTIRVLDLQLLPEERDTVYLSLCSNELPYNWNGTDLFTSGEYIDTIAGQIGFGCDTIRTLDLFIEPMIEDTIYASICANQLPYDWNGNQLDSAGLYMDTIVGQIGFGCDTIRTLDLFIEPMIEDTIYASICANQLPYDWNGNQLDSAGLYMDTIAGQIGFGCDTIRTLDLFIEPMIEDTIYASICANQLPYDWNGNQLDSAGLYMDTIAGQIGFGCDTIRTLDLFIEPMIEDTIYASICANQLPYDWNGNQLDSAGLYIDTIAGQIGFGCDTIRTLDLFIEPMIEDTIYASICANQLPYDWNGNQLDSAGFYIDTIAGQIGFGCDTIRTLDLFIEPMIEDTIYASICANQLPYDWNGNQLDSAGFYIDTIAGQIGFGCDTIRTLDLFIEPMIEDTIYASICANQLPYDWNGNQLDSAGFYIDTIAGQIGFGCDTIRTLDLFIEPMIEDTIYASICANQLPYDWNGNQLDSAGFYIDTIAGQIGFGCDTIRTLDLFIESMIEDTIYASICANQLPYDWNGNQLDSAGFYIDTIAGQIGFGCDTIRTLDLFIESMIEDTIYASICANQLPYDWNGNQLDSAGFYIDTIAGQIGFGCDTIRTLDLFIEPMIEDTIYASICANQLPYDWNGNQLDSAGLYMDTIAGQIGFGCDTIRTLDLFIEPMIEDTIYASICANQLPYDWNGNQLDSAGFYIDTIAGQIGFGCDTIRTLDLFIEPMIEDTIYASICANQLPYDWNGNQLDSAGFYIDTIAGQIGFGCDTIRTLDLFIEPMIEDTIYASICANQLPYDWNGNQLDSAGFYIDTIAGQIGFGCDTIRTLDLFIEPMIEDTIYASICANQLPYDWNGNQLDSAGLYMDTIAGQIGFGCDTIRTLDLFIEPMIEDTIYASICANQLPYDWNGNQLDSAGFYIDTIAGQIGFGCDTIRTLDLFIEPMIEDTIYASICANQLPYDWNGNLLDSAGLYMDTIAGQIGFGCDTIRTLDLFIEPMIEDTIYASICANQLPYDWNGNQLDSAGLYMDTIAGQIGFGCDTIRTLDLFIEPMIEDTIYASICANQLPYDWNGNQLDSAGFYIDTIAGQIGFGCDTIRTLDLFIEPMIEDTIYASICANQLPYDWNGNLLDSAGLYIDTIAGQIGFGCDTIKVLSLEIGPLDTVIIDTLLCYGDLTSDWNGYEISSIVDSSYKASLKNTFGCDSLVTLNVEILPVTYSFIDTTIFDSETPFAWNGNSYDTTGIYIDTTTNTVGCDSIMTLDLEILYGTESETWDSICENELPYEWNGEYYDTTGTYFVVLPNANAAGADSTAYIYLTVWETTYGTLDTAICEPDMPLAYRGKEYNAAGIFTDTLVNANGCDSILTITLDTWPVEETFETLDICESDLPYSWQTLVLDSAGTYRDTILTQHGCDSILVLALNVNSGVAFDSTIYACESYVWDWGDGNTYTSSGIYEVITGGANGCGDTLRLNLIISPALSVTFATEDVSCFGDSDGSIMVAVLGGIPPYSYKWGNGAVANDLDNISAGNYVITIKDSIGCTVTDSVFVNEPDSIAITIDLVTDLSRYNAGDGSVEVSVDGGTPAYSFVWKDDLDSIVGTNEDLFNQSAGTYTLLVTDANNCTSIITVTINEPEPEQRMDCQPNVELLCFEELAVYPLATTLQEYVDQLAPSEEVYSDCGLDLSTFTVSDSVVESSVYCHEEIRYYSITDSCGEVLTCEQRVIVNDTIPPTLVCPPNDTLENATPPAPFTLEQFIAAGGDTLDNCGVVSFDMVDEVITGTFELEIKRTYQIADYCGNTAQCTHTIFIDNTNDLVINCPPVVQLCPGPIPDTITTLSEFIAAGGSVGFTVSPIVSESFTHVKDSSDENSCPETITRIYAISNEAGQTATCEQLFIFDDKVAPKFVLRNWDFYQTNDNCNFIYSNSRYRPQIPYQDLDDLHTRGIDQPSQGEILDDNCELVGMRLVSNVESSGVCPKVYTRVYEVWDHCGNTTRQTEVIKIYDTDPPVVSNPDPIYSDCNIPDPYTTIEQFMAEGNVTANDLRDCHDFTMVHVNTVPDGTNRYRRTYRFTDVCGNSSIATQLIYLNDIPATDIDTAVCEGAPAIEWNGTTIPATMANNGSTYPWKLLNAAGCDSIVNLHVTVWPITYGVPEEWPVCFDPSKDSIWNGQTITFDADRTYTDTLLNASGCDSIVSLTVTILPTASSSLDTAVCYNSPAFTWNEIPVSTTVDSAYTAHFATSDGCDSVVTLNVEILPIDFVEIDTTLCEGPFAFAFGTQMVPTSYADSGAVYTEVFTNQFGCDSTVELTVHVIPTAIGHEYWEYCQDEPPLVWNGDSIIFDQSRTYTATIPRENECDSIATLHVTVFKPVEKYIPNTFCEGYPTIPQWGEHIISPTQDSLYQKVIKGGSSHGCDSIVYLVVDVMPTIYSYDTLYLCEGDLDYIWNNDTIPADPAISGTDYSEFLTKASEDNCDSIANLHVLIVYPVFGVDTMEVCYGADPIDWYGQSISTTSDGTYTEKIENGSRYGCDSTVTLTVRIVDDIMPEFAIAGEVCLNSAAPELPDTSINGVTGSWSPAVIATGSLGSTTYVFTPDDGQCALEYTVEVEVVDEIVAKFAAIGPLCQYSISPELPLTSINGVRGSWSPDTIQTDIVGTTNYTFTPDNQDCAKTTVITVEITPEIELSENHQNVEYSPEPIGSIDLNIEGGTAPFTIEWNGPNGFTASSEDMAGLFAGDYTVTVIDDVGCSAVLLVSITSQHPKLDCPPDTIIECPDPSLYPEFTDINDFVVGGGYVEPLSAVTFFDSYDEVDPNGSYCLTILRTYIVGDSYGNLDSCTQRIEFYDNNPPLVVAPAGGSAECLSTFIPNIQTLEDFLPYGTVSDNCAVDSASFAVDKRIVHSPNSSEVTYIFSIRDMCGNLGSDSAVYVLSDTIPPDAVCNSITVHLDSSGNYVLTDIDMTNISAGSSDNCTAFDDLEINVTPSEFTCEDVESGRQVHVEVIDEAGNVGECWANIVVVDELPPVALCQDITVYLDAAGKADITENMIDAGSYDNCELESLQISRDHFDCTDVGNNVVRLIATDVYGNVDSCEAVVTVIDEIPPYITCIPGDTIQLSEEDGTFALTWEYVTDSVWDECGIDTVLLDRYLLDCNNIGQTTITATAYDVNGNTNSCTTEFIVIGNTPPNVQNDSAITAVNIPIDINVVLNDYDLKTNINISTLGVTVGVRNGSVEVDNTSGIATYTPNPGYVGTDIFKYSICDDGIPCTPECGEAIVFVTVLPANLPPVAVDDYFDVPCINLSGNVAMNDYDPDLDDYVVDPVPITSTTNGTLVLYEDGHFEYEPFIDFTEGIDSFQYQIWDEPQVGPSLYDTAWVYITRVADNDCDGVADVDDIDDDNDGIRDNIENGGYWPEDPDVILIDSDQDGIPDYLDIDADNDGIVDNIEGQDEHNYIEPDGWRDDNNNGWDDRYDDEEGGYAFDLNLTDTDGDGIPDYLDSDSDNDNVPDYIEGSDDNADGIPDYVRFYSDLDRDGLDDAYDWVDGWGIPNLVDNETGSIAPLQDFDGDGWRDWRDVNDEDDEYLTRDEDINGNGDYSDDDLDLDGHPEYLDTEMECELFIPEGFSPNDDGVHDFFQILCIYPRYPDAKMMIFNRNGQLIWQKEKYGNYDYWGWNDAWWWGTSDNKFTLGRSGGLPAGNYIYVLELNDGRGTVHNGTVMIAY